MSFIWIRHHNTWIRHHNIWIRLIFSDGFIFLHGGFMKIYGGFILSGGVFISFPGWLCFYNESAMSNIWIRHHNKWIRHHILWIRHPKKWIHHFFGWMRLRFMSRIHNKWWRIAWKACLIHFLVAKQLVIFGFASHVMLLCLASSGVVLCCLVFHVLWSDSFLSCVVRPCLVLSTVLFHTNPVPWTALIH